MTTRYLSDIQVAMVIHDQGPIWDGWTGVRVLQDVIAENDCDAFAVGLNDDEWHSADLGLFSLNTRYIPEPSEADRFTPGIAGGYAYRYFQRWLAIAPGIWVQKRDFALRKMWHATETVRFPAAETRAVTAFRAIGVKLA